MVTSVLCFDTHSAVHQNAEIPKDLQSAYALNEAEFKCL